MNIDIGGRGSQHNWPFSIHLISEQKVESPTFTITKQSDTSLELQQHWKYLHLHYESPKITMKNTDNTRNTNSIANDYFATIVGQGCGPRQFKQVSIAQPLEAFWKPT